MYNNILPYTADVYGNTYSEEFISSFTHDSLAKGQVDLQQTREIVKTLNDEQAACPIVFFNGEMISDRCDQLSDGACSAISFRVAEKAFSILSDLDHSALSPMARERSFAMQFARFVRELEDIATGSKADAKSVQKTIRSEQMALNTITVDREKIRVGNGIAEKVGAMALLYGLKVVESTPVVRVNGNDELKKRFSEVNEGLQEGIYFLRIIQEKYNHKLEEKGHSAIFIKRQESEYYFDPALGAYTLYSRLDKIHLIFNALKSANKRFGVDVMSFHKLREVKPIHKRRFTMNEPLLSGAIYAPLELPKAPVVLFSPGLGVDISAYHAFAEKIAKKGIALIALQYPRTALGTPKLEEPEIIARAKQNGTDLVKFVERVQAGDLDGILKEAPLALIGHSIGGSCTIEAGLRLPQVKATINMDGRILSPNPSRFPALHIRAKNVKEDRTQYNEALEKFMQGNLQAETVALDVRHGDFSSPSPEFLLKLIDICCEFLKKHLVKERG